jgi:hypothetical protein
MLFKETSGKTEKLQRSYTQTIKKVWETMEESILG